MRISSTNEAIARYLHIRLSPVIIRSADMNIPTKDLKRDTEARACAKEADEGSSHHIASPFPQV
jgi:hypothetical protein